MCDFFPVSAEEIASWDGKSADFLLKLDRHGIFPAPEDDAESFRARVYKGFAYMEKNAASISAGETKIILWQSQSGNDKLEVNSRDIIDTGHFVPAWELTDNLYSFAVDYVPGFYLFEKVGLLWGGCSIYDDETEMKVFLLRPAFRKRKRFLIYSRTELIAHELCHCARQPMHDHDIEEYFAYQTSRSLLRRYIGNCFNKETDALLFLLPSILLLIAQFIKSFLSASLPLWPFWGFLAAVLAYFFIRNQYSRNIISKARKKLSSVCKKPEAVLFRSSLTELKILGKSFEKYIESLSPIRREIIKFHCDGYDSGTVQQ